MSEANSHPGLNLGHRHGRTHDEAKGMLFGFWVFMMSDLILFGLLFATYVTMLGGTAAGPGPRDLFELRPAFIETCILLTSSLTIGLALLAMKHERPTARVVSWLCITLGLGALFLAYELNDLVTMFGKGGVPSRSGFLSAFWALVPLHGLHVAGAIFWALALIAQMAVHGLDRQVKLGLLRLGVLWHLLDVVWVSIFSIVYLWGLA